MVEVSGRPRRRACSWSTIQVEALDRSRLLSDVTRALSDQHVNILSASVTHHPRPDRAVAASPSRWPTRRTSAAVLKPCGRSRASTTSTAV